MICEKTTNKVISDKPPRQCIGQFSTTPVEVEFYIWFYKGNKERVEYITCLLYKICMDPILGSVLMLKKTLSKFW